MKLELRADVLDQAIAVADQLHMTPDDVIALALTELVQRRTIHNSLETPLLIPVIQPLDEDEQRWLDAVWEHHVQHLEREEW